MSGLSFLCLGGDAGWHADQLSAAARTAGCRLQFAPYESLHGSVNSQGCQLICQAGPIDQFDAILTRTMPAGNLEQITFRLAALHHLQSRMALVNSPRGLEIAIDKFATLAQVAALGYEVPETVVVQSRSEALEAFHRLGGDCVVKPLFGGEGRGVMRITDRELAWYTFATLDQLGAVMYVQQFVPPGGRDTRLLVIGDRVIGVRRENLRDFRTNSMRGSSTHRIEPTAEQTVLALRICRTIGLSLAAVDLIDSRDGGQKVLEVNAIPGWKGTQRVIDFAIAGEILELLRSQAIPGAVADV